MRYYSDFWLAYAVGLICLPAAFAERDIPLRRTATHPAEMMPMGAWLQLAESERAAVVEAYAGSRPSIRLTTDTDRKREMRIAV